jgi:hypothetical protein
MKPVYLSVFLVIWFSALVDNYSYGQTTALSSVEETLAHPVQPPAVTAFQLQQYLLARVPALPSPATAAQWTSEEKRLRHHILDDVAFHGWPREWVESAPHFEQVGVI